MPIFPFVLELDLECFFVESSAVLLAVLRFLLPGGRFVFARDFLGVR
jgi:hypothetical protein